MEDRSGPVHYAWVNVGLLASDIYPGNVIAHGQLLAVIPIVTTVVHGHDHSRVATGTKLDSIYCYALDMAMCSLTRAVRCSHNSNSVVQGHLTLNH